MRRRSRRVRCCSGRYQTIRRKTIRTKGCKPGSRSSDTSTLGAKHQARQLPVDLLRRTWKLPLPGHVAVAKHCRAARLARMENGFGADFGRVRIHTDARADTLNHSLNARAFTTGHDIFFRSGEYSPDSTPGQTLLAHELTHVLQQSGNERALQRLRQPGGQETPGSLIQPKRLPRHGPALRAASKKAPSEHSLVTLHPHAPVLRRQVMAPAVPELAAPEIAAPPTKFEKAAAETAAAAAEHEAEKTAATSTAALEQMASRPEAPKAVPAVPAVPPVNGVPGPAAEPPTGAAVEAPVESRQAPGQAEATGEAVGSAGTVTAPQAAAPPAQAGAVAAAEAGKPTLGGAPQLPQITASVPARGEAGAAPAAPTQGAGAPAPVAAAAVAKAPEQKAPASPAEDPAFQAVVGKVKSTAARERKHAPAKAKAQEAQSAAVSPPSEISGKAQGGQAVKIAAAPTPAFDAVAFKAQLMKRITELAPKTLQQADDFKEDHKLEGLKGDMQGQVAAGRQAAQGPIAQETARTPDTSSVEPKPVTPLPPAQPGPEPAGVSAGQAAPKPKTSGEVEAPFQAQSAGLDQQMAAGGVTEEQLASANEPEFAGALEAKQEAQADAAAAPQQYRQAEKAQLGQARADSKQAAGQQLRTMHGSRSERVKAVQSRQEAAKQKDEQARAEVGQEIGKIYAETKSTVEGILNDLDGKVGKAFDEGAAGAKESFEGYVDARMKAYKDERYDVIGGSLLWATDKVFGMPSEVNAFYVEGRDRYLKQMDGVIDHVVAIIGTELTRAKDEVAKGREKIQAYLAKQPASLRKVGEEAARNIQDQFADLERSIDDKQGRLIDTLANKYNTNVKAIDDRIEQLKEANKGLASKAWDAVGGVINTIRELKNMLLDTLSRAAVAIGKIILHPIDFLGNLIDGVKLGMSNFVEKLDVNLQQGLIEWLTGAITGAGIQLPEKWDLPGIFQLVMQILGLGFEKLMSKVTEVLGFDIMQFFEPAKQLIAIYQAEGLTGLAKHGLTQLVGEEGVKALMSVVEIFQAIVSGDWGQVWKIVSGHLENLKEMIFGKIQEFISERVIKAGITWIISLFNPVGAFIKACKGIYDIVMFFIERGKQIMALVNAIIDSVTALADGNIAVAAKAIENTLIKGIPVAIGFLASLLGLGNVSEKVQEVIQSARSLVDKALDAVFNSKPVQMVASFIKRVVSKAQVALGMGGSPQERLDKALIAAQAAVNRYAGRRVGALTIRPRLAVIRLRYQLRSLEVVARGNRWVVRGTLNPEGERETDAQVEESTADTRNTSQKQAAVDAAISDVSHLVTVEHVTLNELPKRFPLIQQRHRLTALTMEGNGVRASLNPTRLWVIPTPGTTAGKGGVVAESHLPVTPAGVRNVALRGELLPALKRKSAPNYNRGMPPTSSLPAAVRHFVAGYEWAHLWGPGFGDEAQAGLMLASAQVNRYLQSHGAVWGIEQYLKRLGKGVRAKGGTVIIEATAVSFPDPPPGISAPLGQPVLRRVTYEIIVIEATGRRLEGQAEIRCAPPLPNGAGGEGQPFMAGLLELIDAIPYV